MTERQRGFGRDNLLGELTGWRDAGMPALRVSPAYCRQRCAWQACIADMNRTSVFSSLAPLFCQVCKGRFRSCCDVPNLSWIATGRPAPLPFLSSRPPGARIWRFVFWWRMSGSNRRHHACKAGALPSELIPRILMVPPIRYRTDLLCLFKTALIHLSYSGVRGVPRKSSAVFFVAEETTGSVPENVERAWRVELRDHQRGRLPDAPCPCMPAKS